jgi:drug/metabolite transporter (DMT)-like permease
MTRRGFILFAALGIIWGIPYLFIKIAVDELTPEFLVLARCALAAALLLPIALRRRVLTPALRRWKPLLAFAVVEVVVPWYALNAAEVRLPSSTTGLLLASVPLIAVGLAFAMGGRHRISLLNGLGIVAGMAGVAAVVGLDMGGSDLTSIGLVGIAAIGYAVGPAILARYLHDLPGLGVMTAVLALSAVIYLPVVAITGGWPSVMPSTPVIVSVLVLAVVCSAVAFLVMFALIAEIGPVRMTAITYVNPAVAVIAGSLVLSEPVTVYTGLGFVLILVGSWLVTLPERTKAITDADFGADFGADAGAEAVAEMVLDVVLDAHKNAENSPIGEPKSTGER